MSDDNILKLPRLQGATESPAHTPVDDKKRRSLEKRLAERVALTDMQYADNGDIQGYCPWHEDAVTSGKPSARFNPTFNTWVCFAPSAEGCAEQGKDANLDRMLRKLGGKRVDNDNVRSIDSAKSKKKSSVPELTEKQAVQASIRLQGLDGAMDSLELKRLWDRDTISELSLGIVTDEFMPSLANKPRITIPVYDSSNKYVGCRIYDAMKNGSGSHDNKFFWSGGNIPKDTIFRPRRRKRVADKVVIMEGEPDVVLAYQDFRGKKGVEFVSGTHGSKTAWPVKANELLKDRAVYVLLDNDEAGEAGAKRLVETLKIGDHVSEIFLMHIPEHRGVKDWTDYRRQVVTDAAVARKAMTALMDDAERVYSRSAAKAEEQRKSRPPKVDLLTPMRVEFASQIEPSSPGAYADVNILGRAGGEELLATDLDLECARNKGKKCDMCPLGTAYEGEAYGKTTLTYHPHDTSIMGQIGASDEQRKKKYREDSAAQCPDFQATVRQRVSMHPYVIEDANSIVESEGQEPKQHLMYVTGTADPDSTSIQRIFYKPEQFWKDSSLALLVWDTENRGSELDDFKMPPKKHKLLKRLLGGTDRKPREKLEEVAADFAWNVTSIYGHPRNLLHILVDLVYHSVQRLPFESQKAMKGWLDVMIMGDSHTGKSATTRRMHDFYEVGHIINGGAATRAGILAGMSNPLQGSSAKFAKKGQMPRNHRGMLTIEEAHRMTQRKEDIIGMMADARDNGEFNLTMINEVTFRADTRLLWIANPPGDMSSSKLADFPYGASSAIAEMMGGRENITRLTAAIGVAEGEVSGEDSQPLEKYRTEPKYTQHQAAMQALVQWAWSRSPDHIEWAEGAEEAVRKKSRKLAQVIPEDFPIASAQDVYAKLARFAAAIAARVYSTPDGETLLIQKKHVFAAYDLLREVYGMDSLGLRQMFKRGVQADSAQVENKSAVEAILIEKQAIGLCNLIIDGNEFDVNSIAGTTGLTAYDASQIMGVLQRGSFVVSRDGRRMRSRPALIELAKETIDKMDRTGKTVKPKSARASDAKKLGNPLPSAPRS